MKRVENIKEVLLLWLVMTIIAGLHFASFFTQADKNTTEKNFYFESAKPHCNDTPTGLATLFEEELEEEEKEIEKEKEVVNNISLTLPHSIKIFIDTCVQINYGICTLTVKHKSRFYFSGSSPPILAA